MPAPLSERRAARTRDLLAAADRVIARAGPDVSMQVIAREAGITKPILYRHFGDKSGLYRALAELHTERLLVQLQTALHQPGDRRERVGNAIDTYLGIIEASPATYRFLVHRASAEDPSVHSQVTVFVQRLADELSRGIQRELELPASAAALADTWAHAIVGMVRGAADHWLETRQVSRSELVAELTGLLWGAFAAPPTGSPVTTGERG